MKRLPRTIAAPRPLGRLLVTVGVMLAAIGLHAQGYLAGDVVEYRVRGSYPAVWERGTILRALDGGKQYLVRQKPSQFFPEGPEAAFEPEALRRPSSDPAMGAIAPSPLTPTPAAESAPTPGGNGLLSRDAIAAYARELFGAGEPFANPRRDELLDRIRDHIKARGTDFIPDQDFRNRMGAMGTYSVHISYAIEANYGAVPKLDDYFGTFHLRAANRGSKSVRQEGGRVIVTTEDSQHETGTLTISRDGTYVWKIFRDDPAGKWLKGRWREVRPEELNAWEGGPAVWLERAKQGEDYMVRMGRAPDWPGWIDVGMGKARSPVEYGRPVK